MTSTLVGDAGCARREALNVNDATIHTRLRAQVFGTTTPVPKTHVFAHFGPFLAHRSP